MTRWLPC